MSSPELDSVLRANESFYRAFESLDVRPMEEVWAKAGYVQCFHPGWSLLRGWSSVMESWRRTFENTPEIRFVLTDVQVGIRVSLAWVTLYENITSHAGEEAASAVVLATDIFEKHPEGWLMIHHHGSGVARSPSPPDSPTFH